MIYYVKTHFSNVVHTCDTKKQTAYCHKTLCCNQLIPFLESKIVDVVKGKSIFHPASLEKEDTCLFATDVKEQ